MSLGIRTPGPIHLFSRFRNNSTAFYLGTCVAAPEPEHEQFDIPIMNDIGGRSVPFQIIQDGELAYVSATLNRFDWRLLQSLRALPSQAANSITTSPNTGGNPNAGQEFAGARGTLALGINDWQLVLLYQYAGTISAGSFTNSDNDLPFGRIYSSVRIKKYKESTVGTRVMEVAMILECHNIYDPVTRSFAGGLAATLKGLYKDALDLGTLGTLADIV